MSRKCDRSCPYFWADQDSGYCKKDHNASRDWYSKCAFEDDNSEKGSNSGLGSTSGSSSGSSGSSSGGCYVATCVYGSYDCPPVWTLRRYRDSILAKTIYGRMFIKIYYAVSPKLVKWFGGTDWFKLVWKIPLDKLVSNLNDKGIEDTAYQDKRQNP